MRRSLQIANITVEAKAKAVEVGFDKKQSKLLTIAKEDGAEAQPTKIGEMTKAGTSDARTPQASKTKAKKKASNEAAEASDQDEASPSIVPEPGDQSDSDWDDSEEEEQPRDQSDSDWEDSEDEEQLFSALKAAWDTAPDSVRKRFVKKVLHLGLDRIDDEVWAA